MKYRDRTCTAFAVFADHVARGNGWYDSFKFLGKLTVFDAGDAPIIG